MKIILVITSILFLSNTYAQQEFATILLKSGSTITTYDGSNTEEPGKKIRRKGRSSTNSNLGFITLDGEDLLYFSKSGEIKNQNIKEISSVTIDSKTYSKIQVTAKATSISTNYITAKVDSDKITLLPLPIKKKMVRMQQLIAENNTYTLTNLFSNGINYFYIYDKQNNIIEKQISHSLTKKKSEKAIEIVEQYFPNCENLISGIKKNVENKYGKGMQAQYFLLMTIDEDNNATNYLTNIKCDE